MPRKGEIMDGDGAGFIEGANAGVQTAAARYLPRPKPERRGVALCLSGGGFRAALFHLGAMRRLNLFHNEGPAA